MKHLKFAFIFSICLIFSGCPDSAGEIALNTTSANSADTKKSGIYTVQFSVEPDVIVSGQPVKFNFQVKDPNGKPYSNLELNHEKPIHLYIVSEDLSQFFHQHPTKNSEGVFEDSFTFPNGGKYKLYVDLKPKDGDKFYDSFDLMVSGNIRQSVEIKTDEKFEKTVDGLRVTMKPEGDLVSGKDLMLSFQVFDAANGKPVTDLQNYLGAKAHFVVISKDFKDFVHIHPMSKDNVKNGEHSTHTDEHSNMNMDEKLAGKDFESILSAMVKFPKAGIYRIFATFKRNEKLTVIPFTFEVKTGDEEKPIDLSKAEFPAGAFKIIVSKNGFTPQNITYKANNPLKLAFYRADKESCEGGIDFQNLNIKKPLPVGKVVLVDIPTDKTGEFVYSCNDGKLKGKITIN